MYYYVEFLRALRALRVVGILLALSLLIGVVFRLSFPNGPIATDFAKTLEHSPTAHVKRTRLPDGGTRTVVDDPERQAHAVIVRHGDQTSVTMTSPRLPERRSQGLTVSGAGRDSRPRSQSNTFVVVNPSNEIWWRSLFLVTTLIGLLVATLLGGPLSKENHGHLELAWTKPVSRERYALAAVLVDAATIVVSQVATLVALLLDSLLWAVPRIRFEPGAWVEFGLALIAPIAWYACVTALSASMKRGPGAMIGIASVVAIVTPALAGSTQGSSWPVAQVIHAISGALSYVDPITYVWVDPDSVVSLGRSASTALPTVAGLALVYLALAIAQWRRVEA